MSGQSTPARTPPDREFADDAQLIANLRDGDLEAYEELWRRHIGPALRLARRLSPHQPEDLAAEAFTAVLSQIAVAGGGPDRNFRAYLYTVMRNLAIRWNQESSRTSPLTVLDDPVAEDGPDRVIGDEDARIVLQAFRTLPKRWQQVLWLAEVDEEPRPAIAAQFRMSPNSVSALLRRARHGLRHQCLIEHIPEALRNDRRHVARVLPDLLVGKLTPDTVVKVTAHLTGCETCREVHSQLRSLSWRVKHATLGTLGFGALTMLVKDLGVVGVAAAATTLAGTAVGGLALGGPLSTALKFAAMIVGVVAVVVPVTGSLPWPPNEPEVAAAALPNQLATPEPTISGPDPEPVPLAPTKSPEAVPTTSSTEVVHPTDDIPVIDLWHPTATTPASTPTRSRPTPVDPGSLPGPAMPADTEDSVTSSTPFPSASPFIPSTAAPSQSVPDTSPSVPEASPSATEANPTTPEPTPTTTA
ncbi:MAG: sigma-70 family RNA polymerase sigma factor, partial [Propionibacteriaceae bacterium]|nr:sigma-70 family RNA polymerase sigma factor [Propionibacteriaceae bacterium]